LSLNGIIVIFATASLSPEFTAFLNEKGVTDKEFLGAVEWIVYEIESREYNSEWWRPEALARIKGIADDWSFGNTYVLDRYSRNLFEDTEVNSEALTLSDRENEVNQIESALSKSIGSNALLVGEPGQEKIQVVWSVCRNIKSGKSAIIYAILFLFFNLASEGLNDFETPITHR